MSNIRKAVKEDLGAILKLMRELVDFHYSLDSYYRPAKKFRELRGYITSAIKNPKRILLVAESDNQIIGYFLGSVEPAPVYSSEKIIGLVADACVSKEYRRQGALKKLLEEALKWFSKKSVNYIELSVDIRNEAAVLAWRNLGFQDYKLRMRKKI